MNSVETFLARTLSADFGKLILRFTLGFLMIFHGYKKLIYGIEGIKALTIKSGFPEFIAYGVYLGEIIVPILIILGLWTRISSFIYASTMGLAIYLAYSSQIFMLNAKSGGLYIETPLFFMLGAISLMFIGAGKYSIDRR